MKFLLDTHLLLWAAKGSEHLPLEALKLMSEPENELIFSVASLWEIVIKCSLGREATLKNSMSSSLNDTGCKLSYCRFCKINSLMSY